MKTKQVDGIKYEPESDVDKPSKTTIRKLAMKDLNKYHSSTLALYLVQKHKFALVTVAFIAYVILSLIIRG